MKPEESPEIEIVTALDEEVENVKLWSLVLFNDDVNTFDHVIDTLVDVCDHELTQAEQCAMIIHLKGKCAVNSGEYEELVGQRNEICKRGISAEVMVK
ncbi:ATP-dependent Clp protease adaptor ClpS [Arcticibacterium luteifluviistationis]|uniref:Clp protease ClpS n=1 Tax=Arcticibacterium luteifluviistationis TaxID=1784714 RepID=A0A2Z4GG90_9BACT|nr:ATP-dependent Clp protease adaptor ClpS [Arcticibacterium luteifluviistationis]AWW00088.1 Clp protease ClpS [Arcticibacterium luteifluviistationis]